MKSKACESLCGKTENLPPNGGMLMVKGFDVSEYQSSRDWAQDQVNPPANWAARTYAEGRQDERTEWENRILPLLTELEEREYLSEQQCAKFFGGDLLDWRIARDGPAHPFAQEGTV